MTTTPESAPSCCSLLHPHRIPADGVVRDLAPGVTHYYAGTDPERIGVVTERRGWRAHLSDPPVPHTLVDLMLLVLDIAAEDAATVYLEANQGSARSEAAEAIGYDVYDAARVVLEAMAGMPRP